MSYSPSHHPAGQSFSGRPKCEAVNETPQCSTSCDNQQDYNQDKSFGASAYGRSQCKLSGGAGRDSAKASYRPLSCSCWWGCGRPGDGRKKSAAVPAAHPAAGAAILGIGVRCAAPGPAAAAAVVYADFSRRLTCTRFSQSLCCPWSSLIVRVCVCDCFSAIANNEEAIMQEIYSNGPIVAGFMVYADFPH